MSDPYSGAPDPERTWGQGVPPLPRDAGGSINQPTFIPGTTYPGYRQPGSQQPPGGRFEPPLPQPPKSAKGLIAVIAVSVATLATIAGITVWALTSSDGTSAAAQHPVQVPTTVSVRPETTTTDPDLPYQVSHCLNFDPPSNSFLPGECDSSAYVVNAISSTAAECDGSYQHLSSGQFACVIPNFKVGLCLTYDEDVKAFVPHPSCEPGSQKIVAVYTGDIDTNKHKCQLHYFTWNQPPLVACNTIQ